MEEQTPKHKYELTTLEAILLILFLVLGVSVVVGPAAFYAGLHVVTQGSPGQVVHLCETAISAQGSQIYYLEETAFRLQDQVAEYQRFIGNVGLEPTITVARPAPKRVGVGGE